MDRLIELAATFLCGTALGGEPSCLTVPFEAKIPSLVSSIGSKKFREERQAFDISILFLYVGGKVPGRP